jgi:regulator of replication initiation timing
MPLAEIDLKQIEDEKMRQLVGGLLNIIEDLSANVSRLQEENQRLRDEVNHLKGEQGKPNIKPPKPPKNYSSEKERRSRRQHRKKGKRDAIKIDRIEELAVERSILPADAEFKGHEEVVVQEIALHTDNILFRKEKFYSVSAGKTYRASLPAGYEGTFGPRLRAQVLTLHYVGQMTERNIHTWLTQIGIDISEGTISNMLIKGQERFHKEEAASYEASLSGSPWQHIDDTGTRVNGENHYCHIVDSPLATHYHTTRRKNRLTIIDVLSNGRPRQFRCNDEALQLMEKLNIPYYALRRVTKLTRKQTYDEDFMAHWLPEHLPRLNQQQHDMILSSMAVAAYQAQSEYPVVKLLICDDAPQFRWVTDELALCWVHEGRHYKKLSPVAFYHQNLQQRFLRAFWRFYKELNSYREHPTPEKAVWLDRYFDRLFATHTGYDDLDKLISRTQGHKKQLLMVLTHPEIPLHNNPAELGARQRVRKRKISFGPRVQDGVLAWDTFMSLVATTQKLGVNFQDYMLDRMMAIGDIPPLPDLIEAQAQQLNLGASWQTL